MGTEFANKAIECSIDTCRHHCCCEDYCSLAKIRVGPREEDADRLHCTDCQSFEPKKSCC